MKEEDEKRIAAKLVKTMAMLCARNTHLEAIHTGKTPVTKTGDWSDVTVVDADGNRIPWTDVSHISDDEMPDLPMVHLLSYSLRDQRSGTKPRQFQLSWLRLRIGLTPPPGELCPRVGVIITSLHIEPDWVLRFYNQLGSAEQLINEGKCAFRLLPLAAKDA